MGMLHCYVALPKDSFRGKMAESAVWNIQLHYQSSTSVFFFRPPRPSPKRLPTGTPWVQHPQATSNNDNKRQRKGPMFCKDLYSTIIANMTWYEMLLPFWISKSGFQREMGSQICGRHPDGPSTPGCRQVLLWSHRAVACSCKLQFSWVAIQNHENIPQTILTISTPNEFVVLPRNTIEVFDDFSSTGTSHSHCCEVCNTNRMAAEAACRRWHGQWMAWGAVDGQVNL